MTDDDNTPNGIELHHWICPDCGKHHKFPEGGNVKQCVECSALLVRMDKLEATPNEELRALVDKLRKVAKDSVTIEDWEYIDEPTDYCRGGNHALNWAADELEAVIEDE